MVDIFGAIDRDLARVDRNNWGVMLLVWVGCSLGGLFVEIRGYRMFVICRVQVKVIKLKYNNYD